MVVQRVVVQGVVDMVVQGGVEQVVVVDGVMVQGVVVEGDGLVEWCRGVQVVVVEVCCSTAKINKYTILKP